MCALTYLIMPRLGVELCVGLLCLLRGCIALAFGLVSLDLHCFLRLSSAGLIVVLIPWCCWTFFCHFRVTRRSIALIGCQERLCVLKWRPCLGNLGTSQHILRDSCRPYSASGPRKGLICILDTVQPAILVHGSWAKLSDSESSCGRLCSWAFCKCVLMYSSTLWVLLSLFCNCSRYGCLWCHARLAMPTAPVMVVDAAPAAGIGAQQCFCGTMHY